MKLQVLHAAALVFGLCAGGAGQAQPAYQYTDLGSGTAAGINDLGQVVGASNLGATLWSGTTAIGLTFGAGGYASAINDAGQIVGATVAHGIPEAALWNGATLASLNGPGNGFTYANGINGSGDVVGGDGVAVLWDGKTPTDLAISNGTTVAANGINNAGEIVGSSTIYVNGATVATAWQGADPTVLQSLGGSYSEAYAVNSAGMIVGAANTAANSSTYIATVWNGANVTALASLGGTKSYAFAVNNAGLIVGSSTDAAGNPYATLWDGKSVVNLNTVLNPAVTQAGWVLTLATGINNEGWIVGDAVNARLGESDAFVLRAIDPVPEPETWGMLSAGLILFGIVGRFKPVWFNERAARKREHAG